MKILMSLLALLASLNAGAASCHGGRVTLGDERFGEYVPSLEGKRVAVFSNHSGIVGDKVKGSRLADEVRKDGVTDGNSLIPFTEPSVPGEAIEYGPHLVDVLLEKGVDVRGIFSPEHGFRGTADAGEPCASSPSHSCSWISPELFTDGWDGWPRFNSYLPSSPSTWRS